jgi:eukaryotic-like serine/threonine-protein kinase
MTQVIEEAHAEEADDAAAKSWELEEGDAIAPGLSALKRLGGGTRYEAYLAWDERLHAIVVVKLVRPHLTEDAHTLAGLAAEIAMVERLAHPVVVRGFGSDLDGERPRLVLEHIEGPRVSSFIRRHGPFPPEQLIPLALQLASALHYLAAEGVVHLDVKPANIIMSGPPRLIDLSVAVDLERAAALRSPVGTDTYMAPEQCFPQELGPVGPPADIWGLGATLYRAASGERPFGKGNPKAAGEERWPQLARRPEPLDPRRVPPVVAEVIFDCLDPDPAKRPAPAELNERLEPVLRAQGRPKLAALRPRWN